MITLLAPSCATLEMFVMIFQIAGVASLCVTRLFPGTIWAIRGRVGFVVSLVGLGMSGAMCGRHDSHFALIAGATMTALLLGMIAGAGSLDTITPSRRVEGSENAIVA